MMVLGVTREDIESACDDDDDDDSDVQSDATSISEWAAEEEEEGGMIHGSLEDAMHSRAEANRARESFLNNTLAVDMAAQDVRLLQAEKLQRRLASVRRQASKQVVAPALPQSADGNDEDDDERMQKARMLRSEAAAAIALYKADQRRNASRGAEEIARQKMNHRRRRLQKFFLLKIFVNDSMR